MRVLIVSNTYPPADISGVGALVYELAYYLGPQPGHFVRVLTRTAHRSDPYAVPLGGKIRGLFLVTSFLWYLVKGQRQAFDLLHLHESDGAGVVLAWKISSLWRRRRPLLVSTLQVSYDEERRMVRPVLADGTVVSKPNAVEMKFVKKSRIQARLGRWIVRHSATVVAPSQKTRDELIKDYDARDVEVVYNGIAISPALDAAFQGRKGSRSESTPTVVYHGRLRTRKGVAVLLAAFRQVLNSGRKARLLIIGDGEQMEELRVQHSQLRLGDAVELAGHRDREHIPAILAAADIYCLPSLYEGLPLAILEAMAAGLPVVCTNVSGNPEAVIDGETGLVVEPESATRLAEALIALIDDPDRARAMGLAGRRRLESEFTIEKIAAEYLALWRRLLAEKGAA